MGFDFLWVVIIWVFRPCRVLCWGGFVVSCCGFTVGWGAIVGFGIEDLVMICAGYGCGLGWLLGLGIWVSYFVSLGCGGRSLGFAGLALVAGLCLMVFRVGWWLCGVLVDWFGLWCC